MLELYHHGSSVCAAKVRLVLAEKGLDWQGQYVERGFEAPDGARMVHLYDRYLAKMEADLAGGPWLAGEAYSLADAGMTPYVARLDMLQMQAMWTEARPRLTDWFARIEARPSYAEAVEKWVPDHLRNDLTGFGAQNWPAVRNILAAA